LEFRDRLNASRPRRTVIFKDKSLDWADYASAVSPAWHQWLRATQIPAPTIEEQLANNSRQEVQPKMQRWRT
jgi:NADH:ubiquinone oxidoreductase subunit